MKILFVLTALLVAVSVAGAEMYQWTAEDGSVTYKDTPPPVSKKRSKVKVYRDSDFVVATSEQPVAPPGSDKNAAKVPSQPAPAKKERFSGTVEIYITDWCGYCKQAQSYMKSKGIPYVAYDIEKDMAAYLRHKELKGNGVPLIIIGSNRMSGFSAQTLEYYLDNTK